METGGFSPKIEEMRNKSMNEVGNAVYASATTERTDVLSVKGVCPMFSNPISLLQASLQNLIGFENADANFQNILNCIKYRKNIDN